jgi:sec-independent protein translocase protein TatA
MELVIVLVLVLMIFGVGKLPEVGGAIGRGLAAFRKGVSTGEEATGADGAEKRKQSEAGE